MPTLWIAFGGLVVVLVLLDLFVLRPIRKVVTPWGSLAYTGLYLALGTLFTFAVYGIYEHQLFNAGEQSGYQEALRGHEATLQYLACFVLELVLSLDSAFVIAAVFAHFGVRPEHRHRLLFWGLLVAMLFRAGVILLAGTLIHSFEWFRFVLAVALLVAALRMVIVRRENLDPDRNILVRAIKKIVPIRDRHEGSDLLLVEQGKPALTPLVLPLLLLETADVFMALDSIPASFVFTREPFLIFSASIFALLVVRSAAPLLVLLTNRVRYFKIGLTMILAYCAVVIALPTSVVIENFGVSEWKLSTLQKLTFVLGSIVFGLLAASILGSNPPARSDAGPLGEDADRIARQALTNIRKVFVFVIGVTGLIFGGIMAVGPGPGIPILFIALLILASEFVWARVLVAKYRVRVEHVANLAATHTRKRIRPWAMVGIIGLTIGVGVLIRMYGHLLINEVSGRILGRPLLEGHVPIGLVIGAMVPFVVGQLFLGYLAFVRPHERASGGSDAPPTR